MIKKLKLTESILNEAPNDEDELRYAEDTEDIENQEDIEDTEENNENIEDTIEDEENQEENPLEEDSNLEAELDELREILVDLDLRLYKIINKEDTNDYIYIIGKVAEDSNDTLMLIDTEPEEINDDAKEDIEDEEIINNINEDEESNLDNPDDIEDQSRFDFVVLPKSYEEINKLAPRYGEGLNPDHEALVDYLMNCLIEVNPKAAEEINNKNAEDLSISIEEPDTEEAVPDLDIDDEEEE